MFDSLHEECGVFGVYENEASNVAQTTYLGLFALQHRGQESAGIAVCDDGVIRHYKGAGLVEQVFNKESLNSLGMGNMAIGHVRYSTTGGNNPNNIQPLVVRHIKGNLALVHNGNLTNAAELRNKFEMTGAIFHATSDTESIAYSIVKERINSPSIEDAIKNAMNDVKGAYSCIAMSATKLIAFRDPNGFRPLCIGSTPTGGYVVASESCAIDSIGAKFIRDIRPGEILTISNEGLNSSFVPSNKTSLCIFEYIYLLSYCSNYSRASYKRIVSICSSTFFPEIITNIKRRRICTLNSFSNIITISIIIFRHPHSKLTKSHITSRARCIIFVPMR